MELTFTGGLLVLLARYFDYRERVTSVPNVLAALAGDPRFSRHRRQAEEYLRRRRKLHQAIHNLKRRGYLQDKVIGHATGVLLTPKGERKVFLLRLCSEKKKTKLPHGQWLMVFFDIPESIKKQRSFLRAQLRLFGFEPLQKSVWATPYDMQQELRELLDVSKLTRYVKSLLVRELQQ